MGIAAPEPGPASCVVMSAEPSGARLEITGALAQIVLARPERRNAIDLTMAQALQAALAGCADDPGVRALLIRAEGPSFSPGGDLGHVGGDPGALEEIATEMVGAVQDTVARVAELEVPVVCAAHGATAGVALGLLWASDIVIAADDLKLATAFAGVGVSGDGGNSWWLPRLVGLRRAQELMLENRRLSAAEALDWGLVTRVVPAAELAGEAQRTAVALAEDRPSRWDACAGCCATAAGRRCASTSPRRATRCWSARARRTWPRR